MFETVWVLHLFIRLPTHLKFFAAVIAKKPEKRPWRLTSECQKVEEKYVCFFAKTKSRLTLYMSDKVQRADFAMTNLI